MKRSYIQLVRYGLVGGVNTALTFSTFWLLRSLGAGLDVSNLVSYVAGMACSFVLNKLWTFGAKGGRYGRELLLFAIGAGLCWAVQWCAFRAALLAVPELLAQATGMVVYTLLNFIFNKLITFRPTPS